VEMDPRQGQSFGGFHAPSIADSRHDFSHVAILPSSDQEGEPWVVGQNMKRQGAFRALKLLSHSSDPRNPDQGSRFSDSKKRTRGGGRGKEKSPTDGSQGQVLGLGGELSKLSKQKNCPKSITPAGDPIPAL